MKCFVATLALLFLAVPLINAQATGRLTGSVVDASGAVVPGAAINLLLAGGSSPVLTATTTTEGLFNLAGIRPDYYDVSVSAAGFVTATVRQVKIDPARETALPPVKLELATVTAVVDVTANLQNVQVANAEVSSTVTNEQVRRLPVLDRSPLALINSQAGVAYTGRSYTVINGQRTSYSSVTLDGINVQDNYLRANALDFLPNLLLLDQIAEFTISTSNANAALGGGASQVTFVTPSGSNSFHGSGYWYNRNNALAANDWFDNQDGIERAYLNLNQVGGSLGGPIFKDKLLFYTNYEAYRNKEKSVASRTILTADARQGLFTYRDLSGEVRKINVLQATGVQMDPYTQKLLEQVPGPEKINNFRVGDSRENLIRNTAGYSFAIRDNRTRDNITAKLDYIHSVRHVFSGTYSWNRDINDRPDTSNDYSVVPKVANDYSVKLLSATWRWNPAPAVINELRGGFNFAPAPFVTTEKFGDFLPGGLVFSNPINTFRAQGRTTNTYNLADTAAYVRGKHNFQFGFQSQLIRAAPYNDAGITPTYSLGISSRNTNGLKPEHFPGGAAASDLNAANNLLASLAGWVSTFTQTFNVTSRTSGFVNGATNLRHFTFDNYAGFVQDTWKVLPRLSLTLGLRYEYFTVVDERDSLFLLPELVNNNPIATLMSNTTLNFAGKSAGRPFYNADRNNFAPNVGLAWDVLGNGKTALRAGYSISYVNDETLRATYNNVNTNRGLQATSTGSGLVGRLSTSLPAVPVPAFQVPRTLEDNYRLDSTTAQGLPDPNLRTPYVQQWSFGIQHEIRGNIVEVRYVGNKTTKALRAFDYNQVVIRENGFLDDFLRAQNNAQLSRAATGRYDPAYNANIPGSQPLTVFPRLANGGNLTTAANLNFLQTGQVGEMASNYQVTKTNGAVNFYRNPFGQGMNTINNYSNASYNALQVEVRRRTRSGLQFQGNYTYSKVLGDALGEDITRFEPFLDMANPKIERARAPFDQTHAIKANAVYDLPLGKGRRIDYRPLDRVLSGWSVSGILTWQSGTPLSILSARNTVNRSGRSGQNTATTLLTKAELDKVIGFRMTGDGPYFADASIIGPDGRAVAPDGSAPFAGQAFYNPGAGQLGALQRRMFSGPWAFNLDFGIQKTTRITERHQVELRMESTNVLNHPTFYISDQNINSTSFARITDTFFGRRIIQLGLYYRF